MQDSCNCHHLDTCSDVKQSASLFWFSGNRSKLSWLQAVGCCRLPSWGMLSLPSMHLVCRLEMQRPCRYLVEAPPNICTPTHLAYAAAKIAEGAPDVMQLEVLEESDCEKLDMGCYLAVAACSAEPPKFIQLTYKPKGTLA